MIRFLVNSGFLTAMLAFLSGCLGVSPIASTALGSLVEPLMEV